MDGPLGVIQLGATYQFLKANVICLPIMINQMKFAELIFKLLVEDQQTNSNEKISIFFHNFDICHITIIPYQMHIRYPLTNYAVSELIHHTFPLKYNLTLWKY